MDMVLQTLLSWQFIMFCLGIAAMTFIIRKLIDFLVTKFKFKKFNSFWSEVLLPILPVVLGSIVSAMAVKYPFPEGISALSSRVFFGMVAGLFSGLVYRIAKSSLSSQIKRTKSGETNQ